jgi:Rieske 2Fe-2S family protein
MSEWFCVGREEEIGRPRDYLVLEVAGESIVVTRTPSGDLRGFYNVCRHRGSQLRWERPSRCETGEEGIPGPSGTAEGNSLRCPYHAWTYSLEGELRGAPFLPKAINKRDFSLHPVGVESWGGFLFVNLTPAKAPPLGEQLHGAARTTERYGLAQLRSAHRVAYRVHANWKVIHENYNECYHCGPVHPELCKVVPAFKEQGGAGLDWEEGIPHRDGAYTFTLSGESNRRPLPGLSREERERHKGEVVFPNLLISLSADHVTTFMLWPDGPDDTTIVCDWLFHPGEMARDSFDPSDAVELWDLVNRQDWRVCESVQRGMNSRVFERGYLAPMENLSLDIREYVTQKLQG